MYWTNITRGQLLARKYYVHRATHHPPVGDCAAGCFNSLIAGCLLCLLLCSERKLQTFVRPITPFGSDSRTPVHRMERPVPPPPQPRPTPPRPHPAPPHPAPPPPTPAQSSLLFLPNPAQIVNAKPHSAPGYGQPRTRCNAAVTLSKYSLLHSGSLGRI